MAVRQATLICGDALAVLRAMPARSVHCCVTSFPYWSLRDYGIPALLWSDGWRGSFGLEPTPQLYLDHAVLISAEIRRVLRNDGTLFLNMGDSYVSRPNGSIGKSTLEGSLAHHVQVRRAHGERKAGVPKGLKHKDLVGMPWRLAFALQDAGWWLRRDVIWSKPNPMPESVRDRPTTAHEYVFLLTKSERYFYDAEAVREAAITTRPELLAFGERPDLGLPAHSNDRRRSKKPDGWATHAGAHGAVHRDGREPGEAAEIASGRNLRSVWTIPTSSFPEAHFATFPPELARRCIAAGTSERGCCSECGAPWKREVMVSGKTTQEAASEAGHSNRSAAYGASKQNLDFKGSHWKLPARERSTSGWLPSCGHVAEIAPCTVLDPFSGAGTTAMVALRMGRNAIGIELKPDYCEMAARRIERDAPLLNRVEVCSFSEPQCILGGAAA